MTFTILGILLAGLFQLAPVDLTLVTLPPDSGFDVPLGPGGEAEVRRRGNRTEVRVRVDRLDALRAYGDTMPAYVVWAVSPEGEFENLGELVVDRRGELETWTSLARLGLLVTAEPYFSVDSPSAAVAFRSMPPDRGSLRNEPLTVDVGRHDYSAVTLPPQGSLSSRVIQARMAFRVAEHEQSEEFAPAEFRQARVALDSMEQLLRRSMPIDVLIPYIDDAIRLSARAIHTARSERIKVELANMTRRAENLEQRAERQAEEIARLDRRQEEMTARLDMLQSELQAAREVNRQVELSRAEVERQLRAAETEIATLSDPWPPLVDALTSAGARQVPRGIQITLPGDRFENDESDFAEGTREILGRLVGVLSFGETPEIRVEGHMSDSVPASRGITLSEDRAQAVRDYLVEAGIPEDRIRADGLGASRPLIGGDGASDPANERVEILIVEP